MEKNRFGHIRKVLARNKQRYLEYNEFRKKMFCELSPETGEIVLYLLPWLLSINDPACPGYVRDLDRPFCVHHIEAIPEIKAQEDAFKARFSADPSVTFPTPDAGCCLIEGLYTIGSVGTVSQTHGSDCDIWVCINKGSFNQKAWQQVNQKLNLIKDWMDVYLGMPVYFFISDVNEIRLNRFGRVDAESSGSAQQNTLKEEFYRTCITICGKIPLWWLCFDPEQPVDHAHAAAAVEADAECNDEGIEEDLIDLGDLKTINRSEYFGAALWQFQKSLLFPLKSIIKMALLDTALYAPDDPLLCHQYRATILTRKPDEPFPDPNLFTAGRIFDSYARSAQTRRLAFLKECLYLKCGIGPGSADQTMKNKMAGTFFTTECPLPQETVRDLSAYDQWNVDRQMDFGERLFQHLQQIFTHITDAGEKITGGGAHRDLIILSRKISAFFKKKENKITIIRRPNGRLNIGTFHLGLDNGVWELYSGDDREHAMISSPNVVRIIAFMVWNDFFSPEAVHMLPNISDTTIQEIRNLGEAIREIMGTYKTVDIGIDDYLKEERVSRLLAVSGFEKSPWAEVDEEYSVVYINCWGELFVEEFESSEDFQSFIKESRSKNSRVAVHSYLRRSSTAYEKIIARTKNMLFPST